MLMVEVKGMMKMRDYCVFDAFLPESLICGGAKIERAWALTAGGEEVPCHEAPASSKQSPEP